MNNNQTPPEDTSYQPPNDEQEGGGSDDQGALVRIDQSGLASIARSEAMAQVDVAHAYPRDLKRFEKKAVELATFDQVTAKLCMYTLERTEYDKVLRKRVRKDIVGPSIRLAEIVASTYQNIHVVSRATDIGESTVTCLGAAWDLENNLKIGAEVSRGITGRSGKRYPPDMVVLTINATSAIARRNAIFSVVPKVYVNRIFERVKEVATGAGKPLQERREAIIVPFGKFGIDVARILARVERASLDEIGVDDLANLAGLWTRLKQGEPADELFPRPELPKEQAPMPGADQEGQKVDLGKKPEPVAETKMTQETTQPIVIAAQVVQQPAQTQPTSATKPKTGGGAELSFTLKDERAAGEPTPEEIAKMGPQPTNKGDGTGIT
jgi:hypothetical protein